MSNRFVAHWIAAAALATASILSIGAIAKLTGWSLTDSAVLVLLANTILSEAKEITDEHFSR